MVVYEVERHHPFKCTFGSTLWDDAMFDSISHSLLLDHECPALEICLLQHRLDCSVVVHGGRRVIRCFVIVVKNWNEVDGNVDVDG